MNIPLPTARTMTTTIQHVLDIVTLRADFKMIRVHAQRLIALVPHDHSTRDISDKSNVVDLRGRRHAITRPDEQPDLRVTASANRATPPPTSSNRIRMGPVVQPLNKVHSNAATHS